VGEIGRKRWEKVEKWGERWRKSRDKDGERMK